MNELDLSADNRQFARIINGTGGWTIYGATRVSQQSLDAAVAIAGRPVDIGELQDAASVAIAQEMGAEAGMVVNCSAAGIVVAVAACIVGTDIARAKHLPDTFGLENRIVLQKCHNTDFGAPIDQMIRMGGGAIDEIGWCNQCDASELDRALQRKPAAALYVVSYETLASAQLPLPVFLEKCRAANVPSIVDIAGEGDAAAYLALGADLIIISAHKQLGGMTAGIIAGRAGLIAACRAQMGGVGRPGKASKESIASTIAAVQDNRGRNECKTTTASRAEVAIGILNEIEEIEAELFAYPVLGEMTNLRIGIRPGHQRISIDQLARNLETGNPRVVLRREQMPAGYLVLNPRELDDADIQALRPTFERALRANRRA